MNRPHDDTEGPSLATYVETRFNLLTEAIKAASDAQAGALGAAIEATKEAQAAADKRYEQRWEASQKALELGFAGQKAAVEAAFAAQKEAINAALAAADRAVTKAELATEKRFESVNEFRGTLDNQQRTLIPRSEVDVLIRGQNDKIGNITKQLDQLLAERQGVKGGYGYAVGIIGFVLSVLAIISVAITLFRMKG